MASRLKSVRSGAITKVFLTFVLAIAAVQVASEVVICNYEKFEIYDSMYHKRKDDFCVFNDVFYSTDVRYGDFMASSLDYQKIAFVNSKFPIVPPSLYRNFDDIRQLYVRRCGLDSLRITRLIEKMYAGNNQITSIQLDGNESKNLKELYLETNMISDISNITSLPNLKVLVLENNPLIGNTDLAMFSRMTKLWKLDLENTGMTVIYNSLKLSLDHLKRLDLSYNKLTYIDLTLFHTFPKLEHLWLNGNKIFYMEMVPIRTVLPDIRSIVIDENYWGCQHLAIISKYFLDNNIIIRSGECKSPDGRAVHKVCCSDTTELMEFRYIIEMSIKTNTKFEHDIKTLEKENQVLQETVNGMRIEFNNLMLNYTLMMEDLKNSVTQPAPTQSPSTTAATATANESGEDYTYYEGEEPSRETDQDADPDPKPYPSVSVVESAYSNSGSVEVSAERSAESSVEAEELSVEEEVNDENSSVPEDDNNVVKDAR